MASFFAIRRPVLLLIGTDVYQTKIRGNNGEERTVKEALTKINCDDLVAEGS